MQISNSTKRFLPILFIAIYLAFSSIYLFKYFLQIDSIFILAIFIVNIIGGIGLIIFSILWMDQQAEFAEILIVSMILILFGFFTMGELALSDRQGEVSLTQWDQEKVESQHTILVGGWPFLFIMDDIEESRLNELDPLDAFNEFGLFLDIIFFTFLTILIIYLLRKPLKLNEFFKAHKKSFKILALAFAIAIPLLLIGFFIKYDFYFNTILGGDICSNFICDWIN